MPAAPADSAPRPSRVLAVDDDPGILNFYSRVLRAAGYQVEAVPDGEVAAGLVAEAGFDVVLSDISMPGMDGISLLKAVRQHDLDLPVVLVTGSASVETAMEAVRWGALRYLKKPLGEADLLEVIRQAAGLGVMARAKREAMELLGERARLLGDRAAREARYLGALDKIWMAYQPIISRSAQDVFAYEALVRSNDEVLSHPGALFDAAERLDRLELIGRRIRAHVAEDARRTPTTIFINLHPRDLLDDLLFSRDNPLVPIAERVVLEITERAAIEEVLDTPARIAKLRTLGFRIALDDLGAGYAGLSSFAQLQPDVVKLDISLIRGIERDVTRQRLVGSMLRVCDDLRMRTVVEGVETVAERDTLVGLGADLFQGYLFARPGKPFPAVTW